MSEVNRWSVSDAGALQNAPGYWPEDQAPSTVNDAARRIMSELKRDHQAKNAERTATYASGAYALTLDRDLTAGELGGIFSFIADLANATSSATLNINAAGAKELRLGNSPLDRSAIGGQQIVQVGYNPTNDNYEILNNLGRGTAPNVVVFEASGTYTKPANLVAAMVEVIGAGGAGGGAEATNAGEQSSGGGGGAGGYSRELLLAADIGTTETVTVDATGGIGASAAVGGDGGSSSFGALLSALGGIGGGYFAASTTGTPGAGGTGGVGANGDFRTRGNGGTAGGATFGTNVRAQGGAGGGSNFSGGAPGVSTNGSGTTGNNASDHGGGGSGATSAESGSSRAGGGGAGGIIIVTEFF